MVKDKTFLITGGAGFIGSWLTETLVELGAKVTVLDNLSSGSIENIKHLFNCGNFDFIEADVSNYKNNRIYDYIVHAASIPAPDMYVTRPVETMLPNSIGTLNILEVSRKYGSRVLFLSTSEVYGDARVVPTPENYWGYVNPIGIRSCYDESKRFGEALCMAYFRQYGIDVRIARIFNTYGPRLDPNACYARVISKFIIQALRGDPITIYGDGKQTRSFLYITDAIEALVKFLLIDGLSGEVVNIGSPHEITILELANIIKRLTGSNSPIEFHPPRPDDPKRRCPDISKAQRILNWNPKVSLHDGLELTIAWFKKVIII
ncbi:MAG: UDP-glucuronic acid decarboxylase family protein [Candidatus Nezhaarchaeales archaeon]